MDRAPAASNPSTNSSDAADAVHLSFSPAITLALTAAATSMTVPFVAWNALQGNWDIATLVASLDIVAALIMYHIFRHGGLSPRLLTVLVSFGNLLTLTMVLRLGDIGIYWSYPLILLNYFLTPVRHASLLNGAVLTLSLASALNWAGPTEWLRLLPTLTLTAVFAGVFAAHIESRTARLRDLAERDPLTGVGNRRALEQAIEVVLARHRRTGSPAALAVVDVDHFKPINDHHGHDTGDRVLAEIADQFRCRLRATDAVFRYGGEEFVVLLPDTGGGVARELVESIRRRVGHTRLGGLAGVTFSGGIAEVRTGDAADSWLKRADEALYRAKRNGRDRTELAAGHAGPAARRC